MTDRDLAWRSAVEQAGLVRSGQVRPLELLEALVKGGVPAASLMPGTGHSALTDSVKMTSEAVRMVIPMRLAWPVVLSFACHSPTD